MSRRKKYCQPSKRSRACVSSFAIPDNLVLQSSLDVLCVPSQSSLNSSSNPSYNEQEYCDANSCRNSQTCIKTHPHICPYGLRDNDDECQEPCDRIQPANDYEPSAKNEAYVKPITHSSPIREEDAAGTLPVKAASVPKTLCISSTAAILSPHSTCSTDCPSHNTQPSTTARRIHNQQCHKNSCTVCRGSDDIDTQYNGNTISTTGYAMSERAPRQDLQSCCCNSPPTTLLRDEVPYFTCTREVNHTIRSNLRLNASTQSQRSVINVIGKEVEYCEQPKCIKIGKSNEIEGQIDGFSQDRDLEQQGHFHSNLNVTSRIPSPTACLDDRGSVNKCCNKPTCKKLAKVNENESTNKDVLNKSKDLEPRRRFSSFNSNFMNAHRSASSNVENGIGQFTTEKLDESVNGKNICKLNKEQNNGNKLFYKGIPENISPPIRIISGIRVCDICSPTAQLHKESKQRITEESMCSSALCATTEQAQGCQCHFPPAFKHHGCTGFITGNCHCRKKN